MDSDDKLCEQPKRVCMRREHQLYCQGTADSVGWNNNAGTCVVGNNLSANNATDFSAVPAGFCYGSSIYLAGNLAGFWSSSQNGGNPYYAYFRSLYYDNTDVGRGNDSKFGGYSVRCLRDN